jgi:stage II sporulation protein D
VRAPLLLLSGLLAPGLLAPGLLGAENVEVRVYSAHPPASLTVLATAGEFRWKSCEACPEHSEKKLVVRSREFGPADMGPGPREEFLVSGDYELRPENAPSFASGFPLRIEDAAGGLVVVVSMPLEPYVERVLAAESGSFRNPEALKAMAVAARSYATHFGRQHAREGFDFCDTTHCQAFQWKAAGPRIRAAVGATTGQVLLYKGNVAATYYHQNCGGMLAASSETWSQDPESYLAVHADPFCLVTGGLQWGTPLTRSQINQALEASGLRAPEGWKTLAVSSRTRSGRAHTVILSGGRPAAFSLSASSLRFSVNRAFGWNQLRSDLYQVRNSREAVLFSGRGAGHGVGLCQAGAEEMARQEKGYREILAFFYPGTQLASAGGDPRRKISDERFDLVSAAPESDVEVLRLAERLLREGEDQVGWRLPFRVQIEVFSTLASYRDSTGQPGWVAGTTRGRTIRLQPLAELRKRSVLQSTLRHELNHLLIDLKASESTPLWFREGLALELSGPPARDPLPALPADEIETLLKRGGTREEMQKAYASAQAIVGALLRENGRPQVLGWLSGGIPAGIVRRVTSFSRQAPGD